MDGPARGYPEKNEFIFKMMDFVFKMMNCKVLVESGAGPWGSVASASGPNFFCLQGLGSYIGQLSMEES